MDSWERPPLRPPQPPPTPLVMPAASIIVGICAARLLGDAWPGATGAAMVLLAVTAITAGVLLALTPVNEYWRRRRCLPAAALAALVSLALLGFTRYRLVCYHFPAQHVLRYATPSERLATVRATVTTPPRLTQSFSETPGAGFHQPATLASVECTAVLTADGWRPASGAARLLLTEPVLELGLGEQLELHARLARHDQGPANPGQPDRRDYYRGRRELVTLYVDHSEAVRVLGRDDSLPARLRRIRAGAQDRASALLRAGRPRPIRADDAEPEAAILLAALLLGRREGLSGDLADDFLRTGTFHYLSVSGFHVGLLAAFAWWIGRLCRLPRWLRGLFALAVIAAFLLVVPDRPPVLRAGIAAIVFCLAYIRRRSVAPINLLALAAAVTLLWRPLDLFNAGFQLSYAVALGILLFVRPAGEYLLRNDDPLARISSGPLGADPTDLGWEFKNLLFAVGRYLLGLALVCTIASLIGMPLAAWHFHRISPWGPLASMLLLPGIALTLFAGFTKLLLALIVPTTAAWLYGPLAALAAFTTNIAETLSRLPYASINTAAPPLWLLAAFYAGLILLALRLARRLTVPRGLLLANGACLVIFTWLAPFPTNDRALRLDLLSVGHGSACVVQWPDGRTICYDAGSLSFPDVGRYSLTDFLRTRGINHLDALFLSHPHPDHCNGAASLCRAIPVSVVYVSDYFEAHADRTVRDILASIRDLGVTVQTLHAGHTLDWDQSPGDPPRIRVLWPSSRWNPDDFDANDASLVLRLTHGNSSVLLTGDIGPHPQAILYESTPADLRADLLVLPHHGSATAGIADFVNAVNPHQCLISSSTPHPTTRSRLAQALPSRELYYTSDSGALSVSLGADAPRVETFRR